MFVTMLEISISLYTNPGRHKIECAGPISKFYEFNADISKVT